jgi:hypothetical protein
LVTTKVAPADRLARANRRPGRSQLVPVRTVTDTERVQAVALESQRLLLY